MHDDKKRYDTSALVLIGVDVGGDNSFSLLIACWTMRRATLFITPAGKHYFSGL